MVELSDDFAAALGRVQLERFERGAVVFAEAVAARYVAPLFKDVIARIRTPHVLVRERLRIKISETRQTFHAVIWPQSGATGNITAARSTYSK